MWLPWHRRHLGVRVSGGAASAGGETEGGSLGGSYLHGDRGIKEDEPERVIPWEENLTTAEMRGRRRCMKTKRKRRKKMRPRIV